MSKGMLSKTAWRLMKSYWKSKEKWRARGLLAGVIALSLGQVYMLVMLNQFFITLCRSAILRFSGPS